MIGEAEGVEVNVIPPKLIALITSMGEWSVAHTGSLRDLVV